MLVISEVEIDQAASAAGLTLSCSTSCADDDAAGDLAGDDHGEAGRDQSDSAEEDRHPAFVPGEVDRQPEGEEGEQREDDRQPFDRDGDVLRRLQLVGAQDRDLAASGGSLSASDLTDPHLVGEIRHQAAQVQLDFAVLGRDRSLSSSSTAISCSWAVRLASCQRLCAVDVSSSLFGAVAGD